MEKISESKQQVSQQQSADAPGRSLAPPSFSLQAGNVSQLAAGRPPGRGICTEFGDYWIVPDNTTQCYANVVGEQITETEFANLQTAWNALKSGSGKIQISENDDGGVAHPGFRQNILGQFGRLMSRPTGRAMVVDLINGSHTVTIRPTETESIAFARIGNGALQNPDGTANVGAGTSIYLDDNLTDDKVLAFDEHGNDLASPVFIILGHELIHATHNAAGVNQTMSAATVAGYSNMEEQATVTGPGLSENRLRSEHNLGVRHGSSGRVRP